MFFYSYKYFMFYSGKQLVKSLGNGMIFSKLLLISVRRDESSLYSRAYFATLLKAVQF